MIEKRPWEKWWELRALPDFPRSSIYVGEVKIDIPTTRSPVRRFIVLEAQAVDSANVLDIGCATAIDFEFFEGSRIRYSGVDLTQKFIDFAKDLYPGIDVHLANALHLPFDDREYDTTYCKSLIEHLHPDEWKLVIKEAWRVANKKMMLCFVLKPWDKPTQYNLKEGGYYDNYLNKTELINFLLSLPDVRTVRKLESTTMSDLYVVRKNE